MDTQLRVLFVDAGTAFYRMTRYNLGDFFGPVDLGLFLSGRYNSLNIGVGLLAGSIFPGSNRLMFTGFSPCWGGFYISSMGGAGLVFENLGINMLSLVGKAPTPSILYLNRIHGEEIQVELVPVDQPRIWQQEPGGVYSMMEYAYNRFTDRYENDPRVLAVGPAAAATDMGAICSVPIVKEQLTHVDTWAGRGGLGSKLYQQHGIVAIIYGGTFIDEDFRDRKVADQWFMDKYQKKLAVKDLEATTKYRFDPKFETGGTFGVNYSTLKGSMLSFNYRSLYMTEEERLQIHKDFIVDHYLKQFNEETIELKQQKHCGEPCVAICKKMNGIYKKDYEPYQTMGPQCGVFDQRAAEKLNHHADMYGFDAISVGGVLAWMMECMTENYLSANELGIKQTPVFDLSGFDVVGTSLHMVDNLGFCRFHRNWAEEMIPEIVGSVFDLKDAYLRNTEITASRINSRNASVFWESERNMDLLHTFLKRKHELEGSQDKDLLHWNDQFEKDKKEASLSFWYEMHKGIQESLKEF